MDDRLTVSELEKRWESTLKATEIAVSRHVDVYRRLKILANDIVTKPLDIKDYLPTVQKLIEFFNLLDSDGRKSIFYFFNHRISPSSIWHVKLLRLECRDLLAHLNAFDDWRRKIHGLKVVK